MGAENWTEYEEKKTALLNGEPTSFTLREFMHLIYEYNNSEGTFNSFSKFINALGISENDYRDYFSRQRKNSPGSSSNGNGAYKKLPEKYHRLIALQTEPNTLAAEPLFWSQTEFKLKALQDIPRVTPGKILAPYASTYWQDRTTTAPTKLNISFISP